MDFTITEQRLEANGNTFYAVEFAPTVQEIRRLRTAGVHSNHFHMSPIKGVLDTAIIERNIRNYYERKLRAADEGRPYQQHHRSTLNLACAASDQDGREIVSSGNVNITATTQSFGSLSGTPQHHGLYFGSVSGLSGVTINSATLTFRATATDSGDFVGDWFAEDGATPGVFVAGTGTFTISGRTMTTATCEGDGSDFGAWTSGGDHTFTGDGVNTLAGITQEIADSHDPSAIVLIHIYASGTGKRTFETWDNAGTNPPKFDIDYTAGGAGATHPGWYGQKGGWW